MAVSTKSQYILTSLLTSGNLNDGKASIPLLKKLKQEWPFLNIRYVTMDAGYDYPAVYEQVHRIGFQSVIAYNKRREPEMVGYDKHFAPTCVREHSYRYDSFDPRYETLKFTRPKECKDCPLAHDTLCQKVYKIKITKDLRKFTVPARGTESWKAIYSQRTAVERVIGYLKEFFQLNIVRYRLGKRAIVHFQMAVLVYNGAELACDRLNLQLQDAQHIAA